MIESQIDIFPWDKSFNTGFSTIDEQHQKLVSLLNKLAIHVICQRSDIELKTVVSELVDYTVYHFNSEEQLWLEALPQSQESTRHKESHDRFIAELHDLRDQITIVPSEIWIEKTLSFLASWLASHILESDRQMAFIVAALQDGLELEEAKERAERQMRGSTRTIVDTILSAYKHLTGNTLQLMREIRNNQKLLCKLSEREEQLQQAMEYAQIGQWELPYQSETAVWSEQMFHILGFSPQETPGPKLLEKIIHQEYFQPFMCSMNNCFQTGQEHHVEYPITRPTDGEVRWIECRGKVSYGEDGRPLKISGFIQDITEHKVTERQIEQLAFYDPLTQLPNRRLLQDRLNQQIAAASRSSKHNALLFLDLDNFKTLNDSHGHDYGDILLQECAKRIRYSLRKGDTLARIGGDEFVVILGRLSQNSLKAAAQAKVIAHNILDALSAPYPIKELQYNSSISIGITLFKDGSASTSELMKQADIAMYQAKQSGRNTLCFFAPQMQQRISGRIELETELRKAIREEQFQLYFQPQFNHRNQITGAEALIRWQHPTRGLVMPGDFITLAEETGLIVPLGEWVLKSACAQLRVWQQSPKTQHITLSVNVSSKQFRQTDFAARVKAITDNYGILPQRLKIELTESLLLDDIEKTIHQMQALEMIGIQFSLDDFGTGYSSLQYLKKLPLYQLKIDRSFVRDLLVDSSDQAIIRTIISMAKGLDLSVIAEGVEELEQQQFLLNEGCHYFQGFLFSKPLPIEELSARLQLNEKSRAIDQRPPVHEQ